LLSPFFINLRRERIVNFSELSWGRESNLSQADLLGVHIVKLKDILHEVDAQNDGVLSFSFMDRAESNLTQLIALLIVEVLDIRLGSYGVSSCVNLDIQLFLG